VPGDTGALSRHSPDEEVVPVPKVTRNAPAIPVQPPVVKPQAPAATEPRPVATPSSFAPAAVAPGRVAVSSGLDFNVHAGMPEIRAYAEQQGWLAKGWTQLSVFSTDLVYTTDHWKTTQSLSSSSTPSPYLHGRFTLPNVEKGTNVEFALHVRVACSDPHDIGGHRERGDLWLNNGGKNFTQVSG
jgi:hypothetical protein